MYRTDFPSVLHSLGAEQCYGMWLICSSVSGKFRIGQLSMCAFAFCHKTFRSLACRWRGRTGWLYLKLMLPCLCPDFNKPELYQLFSTSNSAIGAGILLPDPDPLIKELCQAAELVRKCTCPPTPMENVDKSEKKMFVFIDSFIRKFQLFIRKPKMFQLWDKNFKKTLKISRKADIFCKKISFAPTSNFPAKNVSTETLWLALASGSILLLGFLCC